MRRKSKIAYGNSLTRAFLDHFWYGESISELLLASVPGDSLRFASRARDFRIWNVRLGQPKRDRFRENQDKWTTEMSSPAPNYSRTSWVRLLRSWLSTRTASRIISEKFEHDLPVSGLTQSFRERRELQYVFWENYKPSHGVAVARAFTVSFGHVESLARTTRAAHRPLSS